MGRNLKQYALLQQEECWSQIRRESLLWDKEVLILGAGDIGTGAAKRLKAFGTHVTGMRRTDRNYPDCFDANDHQGGAGRQTARGGYCDRLSAIHQRDQRPPE